ISLTLFRSTSLASVSASATPLLWISGATGLRSADLATADRAESERPTPELAGDIGDRLEIFMAWTTSHLRYRLKATSSAEIFKQKTNFRISKAGFHHALLHHPGSDFLAGRQIAHRNPLALAAALERHPFHGRVDAILVHPDHHVLAPLDQQRCGGLIQRNHLIAPDGPPGALTGQQAGV